MEKRQTAKVVLDDIGYLCHDFVRGEDTYGHWHEETYYAYIETKDRENNLGSLVAEAAGSCAPSCAIQTCGNECDEEERDACGNLDKKGTCRPQLYKIRIIVDAEPLTDPEQIEKWWLSKAQSENPAHKTRNMNIVCHQPLPMDILCNCEEKLSSHLGVPQASLQYLEDLVGSYQCSQGSSEKNSAKIVASCICILFSYEQRRIEKSKIAEILRINPKEVDSYCDDICSSLRLPSVSHKESAHTNFGFNEELKKYALQLRIFVKQGKSFHCICDDLQIKPAMLTRYLKRLRLKCKSVGWDEGEQC